MEIMISFEALVPADSAKVFKSFLNDHESEPQKESMRINEYEECEEDDKTQES